MNKSQANPERTGLVIKDYQAEFLDPIVVEAGEPFTVSEQTSTWDNNPAWIWLWCTNQRGKSGWVPKNIIQPQSDDQTGITHTSYDARELSVTAGQELNIELEESGWFWCRNQQGKQGWVPISHIQAKS